MGMERVAVFSATRLRVPWGQAPRPGTGYQPGLPVCPQLTSEGTSQAAGWQWDVSPRATPCDVVVLPLRDGR